MATKKISELDAATSVNLADQVPIVQGGINKRATLSQVQTTLGEAVSTYADLTDAGTVDLPTVNTPLANALSAKADASSVAESARDAVGAALQAGTHSGLSVSVNDAGDSVSLTVTATTYAALTDAATVDLPAINGPLGADLDALGGDIQTLSDAINNHTLELAGKADTTDVPELARDAVATAIQAGTHSGLSVVVNDVGDSISFTVTGGSGGDANVNNAGFGLALPQSFGSTLAPNMLGMLALALQDSCTRVAGTSAVGASAAYETINRWRLQSAASAINRRAGEISTSANINFAATAPRKGRFPVRISCAIADANPTLGNYGAGIQSGTSLSAGTSPGALTNVLAFGCDEADTNIQLFHRNGITAATKVDTGVPRPDQWELYTYVFNYNAADGITCSIEDIDGTVVYSFSPTTNIPPDTSTYNPFWFRDSMTSVFQAQLDVTCVQLSSIGGGGGSGSSVNVVNNLTTNSTSDALSAAQGVALKALVDDLGTLTWNPQTTSYTLGLTDANEVVEINSASAVNLTVPTNTTVAFPVGTAIPVHQAGAGQISFIGADGTVVIRKPATLNAKTSEQYAMATLIKRDTNTWILSGQLEAV